MKEKLSKEKNKYKALIRLVKSIPNNRGDGYYFNNFEVVREPLIEAYNEEEVKQFLLQKYPSFFPSGKVYKRESKDDAQFFYVLIYPLYEHEERLIEKGEWTCSYCNRVHPNRYVSRPETHLQFENELFCGFDSNPDDGTKVNPRCYELWIRDKSKTEDLTDDINYIKSDSLNYIYKITEKDTNKCYIGKTRNAPFFRWWNHLTKSTSPFGLYLRTTNLNQWIFEVLEVLPNTISESDILKIESDYMIKFDSLKNGFNTVISNKESKTTNQISLI